MHQPIQDYLEDYLSDPDDRGIPNDFHSHIASCGECAAEIRGLSLHHELLRGLRAPESVGPGPGFYAQVMARIEEQRGKDNFWSLLLEPAFGRRLAFACAAFVLVMGTYLVSSEPRGQHFATPSGVVAQDPGNFDNGSVAPQQRDAVLVNLVSFQE